MDKAFLNFKSFLCYVMLRYVGSDATRNEFKPPQITSLSMRHFVFFTP